MTLYIIYSIVYTRNAMLNKIQQFYCEIKKRVIEKCLFNLFMRETALYDVLLTYAIYENKFQINHIVLT